MKTRKWVVWVLGLVISGSASASLYLDFGAINGTPASTYSASSGIAGTWNSVTTASPSGLVNADGSASSWTLTLGGVTDYDLNFGSTVDDGNGGLLNDTFHGTEWTVTLSNLFNRDYEVYIYAPSHSIVATGTYQFNNEGTTYANLLGRTDSVLENGVSYRSHTVTVTDGTLTITKKGGESPLFGLAGLQVIPEPAAIALIGLFGGGLLAVRRIFQV